LKNSCGHSLKSQKLFSPMISYVLHGDKKNVDNKTITKKIRNESISFSERV